MLRSSPRPVSRSLPSRAFTSALGALAAVAMTAAWLPLARAQAEGAATTAVDESYKLHMRNGVKLFQDRNYRAAIVEFSAAYEASPKASPLVNLALCHKAAFDYPQAIAALEKALAHHRDTMDEADQKAASDAVAEMRALLAYVSVRLSPREATLLLDGAALPAGTADAPVPLGPGTHTLSARADGYAPAETSVTVVSGQKDVVVELALVPNQGYVSVLAGDPETAIAVDGRALGRGQWAGLLAPGSHVVQMYKGQAVESRQILVIAGKTLEVRPGVGGVAVEVDRPDAGGAKGPPSDKPPPPPERNGLFALATGSLLGPTKHPTGFPEAKNNTGAAAGARIGYQVNDNAAFAAVFEYGNATLRSTRDDDLEYSISSLRLGLELRLTTSGDVRFVGALGGGITRSDLSFSMSESALGRCERGEDGDCNATTLRTCTSESGCTSLDPHFAAEAGVELDFGGVLVDVVLTGSFQATKGFDPISVYDNEPLGFAGGGVRIGYGDW